MSQPVEISVRELAETHAAGAYVLDVREPDEYAHGNVPGAVPMPMGTVAARHEELPRDRTIYVVCAAGVRSMQVARFLAHVGFDVANVGGGTQDWIAAGLPVEP